MVSFGRCPPATSLAGGPGRRTLDLADLLRQSSWGDEGAFSQLYDASSQPLYGMVVRVVRDPAQSEEVTQEVFLEIWRRRPGSTRTAGARSGG